MDGFALEVFADRHPRLSAEGTIVDLSQLLEPLAKRRRDQNRDVDLDLDLDRFSSWLSTLYMLQVYRAR